MLCGFGQVTSHCSFHPRFQRHLLGPGTLVPCIYLAVRRKTKGNNHVGQTHLPAAAGLTGPAGRARAQHVPSWRVPGTARAPCGAVPTAPSCLKLGLPKIWKLGRTRDQRIGGWVQEQQDVVVVDTKLSVSWLSLPFPLDRHIPRLLGQFLGIRAASLLRYAVCTGSLAARY